MSEDNEFDGNEGEGIKSLRREYNALKKQLDEQNTELASYRQEKRSTSVAGVLKAKGLPEKAASLYTGEDVSEDAVGKWVENYADVFGIRSNSTENDANAAAAQRASDASFGNLDTNAGPGNNGQVVGDLDELERAMRTLPYEELVKRGMLPASGTLFNP